VILISAERIGASMAGPAIRVIELARALSEHCDVTIAAPAPSDAGDVPARIVDAGLEDFGTILEALKEHDVVVAQRLPPQILRYVARMPIRLVADLYNPQMIEVLEAVRDTASSSPRRASKSMLGMCATADLVMCASETQRDLWLGGMGMAGLIDVGRYREDPTFRRFVDVVPFGMPESPPVATAEPVLKGVWPGIGAEDQVLLWAGGIWRWLDAQTPIRAVERLRAEGRPVHLVFLGTGRPSLGPGVTPSSAEQAVAFAEERGLAGVGVHFNPGWVPYAERQRFLLEADLGVSAHFDHLEARFSFRTRVLDHFWAGLPSVVSGGDAIGDLVERRGLGRAVAPGDDAGFATACAALLDDAELRRATKERIREVASEMTWSRAAAPLVEFCVGQAARPSHRTPPLVLARATLGQYPDVLADARDRGGLREMAQRIPRHVARVFRYRAG
jgi:glycosyltransferase involved in cell wall biosynthesis